MAEWIKKKKDQVSAVFPVRGSLHLNLKIEREGMGRNIPFQRELKGSRAWRIPDNVGGLGGFCEQNSIMQKERQSWAGHAMEIQEAEMGIRPYKFIVCVCVYVPFSWLCASLVWV